METPGTAAPPKNPQAVPLITNESNGQFIVHDEAVEILSRIPAPMAVVAVAGKWRTGKSFLLNSLLGLNGQPDSFVVGNTVNACTKGLWLWGEPMTLPDGLNVVFVDSEGLGSTSRTQTEDCQIFSLAVLLSSFFIWNSRGVIDGSALEDFGLVVNLTKHIHVQSSEAASGGSGSGGGGGHELDDLASHFPAFMWVVRDFTLKLETNGRAIDDRQYLESALKPQQTLSQSAGSRNQIRNLLSSFFKQRDCVTLVRPAEDETLLRNLNAQPLESLRPEFVRALQDLKMKLFGTIRPKMLNDRLMNGQMLATLTQTYADALNSGGVPTISTAWDRVLENQAAESVSRAVSAYSARMAAELGMSQPNLDKAGELAMREKQRKFDSTRGAEDPTDDLLRSVLEVQACALPLPPHQVSVLHATCLAEADAVFKASLWGTEQHATAALAAQHSAKLRVAVAKQLAEVEALNFVLSRQACRTLANTLFEELFVEELPAGADAKDGDARAHEWHAWFQQQSAELRARYAADAVGPAASSILVQLLTDKVARLPPEWMAKATSDARRQFAKAKSEINGVIEQQRALEGRLSAETLAADQENASMERATAEALKETETAVEVAKAQVASKEEELRRLEAEHARLEQAFSFVTAEVTPLSDVPPRLAVQLHAQNEELLKTLTEHDDLVAALGNISEAPTDEPAEAGTAEEFAGLAEHELAAKVTLEEREVALMHEHASLIQKNIDATRDLLTAKDSELQECEFHWGVAKASVAHEEGELLLIQDEINVLRSLVAKMHSNLLDFRRSSMPSDLVKILNQQQLQTIKEAVDEAA